MNLIAQNIHAVSKLLCLVALTMTAMVTAIARFTMRHFLTILWIKLSLILLGLTGLGGLSLAKMTGLLPAPIRQMVQPKMSLEEALEKIPLELGVDPNVIKAICQWESMDGKDLHRFEPGKFEMALQLTTSVFEAKQLASSHGACHVLGLTARSLGYHWSELDDNEKGVRAATMAYRDCLDRNNSNEDASIRCYNGSGDKTWTYLKKVKPILAKIRYGGSLQPPSNKRKKTSKGYSVQLARK
jgi:hypothetical protein